MITALTGMQVANASMYDGATAVSEGCLMAVRANRKSHSARVLIPTTVHPHYRAVTQASTSGQGLELKAPAYLRASGQTDPEALASYEGQDVTALVIQQPNFFGVLEDVDALTDWAGRSARDRGRTRLAACQAPGRARGADIVVGTASWGARYLGGPILIHGDTHGLRPADAGRIVGRTVDLDGRPGFTLTLQAREQHIRRGKATSNICTNQDC
jgi:glycine dehydrogenase subunit 1